ncbi:hypothetical protein [Hyphomonas sp. BRH_c22]|uniref:hypothetical protein n=1 Tax=Hyphomonas sp. BRH_c22 TaxID=1629710 RepID=UPI000B2F913B|nr:hypothetical protein [Hyphomonas sp. BRH_c22]
MRQRSCAVIQHIAFEGPGGFAELLRSAGYQVTAINAADGISDEVADADLLIVLGGPISDNDDDAYPFLRDDLRFADRRLSRDQPVMGNLSWRATDRQSGWRKGVSPACKGDRVRPDHPHP